jgi:hypothetical protein
VLPAIDVTSPINQSPRSVAVTDCACDCWFVIATVNVPLEFFHMLDVDKEQEYSVDESHALSHAANAVDDKVKIIAINATKIAFFIFKTPH